MNRFLCPTCNNQLNIKEGDFIFSYNINCSKEHNNTNIDLDELLSYNKKIDFELFKCINHKKKNIIHCFDCNEDICFRCYRELHQNHKNEYLEKLDLIYNYNMNYFKDKLDTEKDIINGFIYKLNDFRNKINLYIDILKNGLKKYHKLRCQLINNITEKDFSYVDYANVKEIYNSEFFQNIIIHMENFLKQDNFLKNYDYMKNIFEIVVKKGKYIEEQNLLKEYNKLKNIELIQINGDYFISNDNGELKILKRVTDINSKKFDFNIIYEKSLNFNCKIVLKKNNNIEKELSFYLLKNIKIAEHWFKTQLMEITIKDLFNYNKNKVNNDNNFIIKNIKTFDNIIDLLILSDNKNIIFKNKNIFLYDDSFNENKIIYKNLSIYNKLIIDENLFVCTNITKLKNNNNFKRLFIFRIDESISYENIIDNCGYSLIYYSKKKKLLFSKDELCLYIINFNVAIPECIQKIAYNFEDIENFEINKSFNEYHNQLIKYLDFFNDDSIYIEISEKIIKNYCYYYITYLIQYKIIEYELKEISRIEIERKKLKYKY